MNEDKVVEKKSILGSVYSFICDHYVLVGTVTVVIICGVAYWYFSGPSDFTKAGVSGSNVENHPDQGVGNSLQPVQENLDLKMDVECENIENTVEQIFDSFSGSSSSEELINLLSLNDNLPKLVEQYPNALSKLAPTFPDFSDLVTNQGIAMAQDPSLFPIWVPLTFIEKGLVIISESGILSYKCVDVALFCTKIQFALYKHLLDTGIYDASIHGSNFQVFVDNGFVDIPLDANFDWDIVLGVLLAF
jgi:hypothetical protein